MSLPSYGPSVDRLTYITKVRASFDHKGLVITAEEGEHAEHRDQLQLPIGFSVRALTALKGPYVTDMADASSSEHFDTAPVMSSGIDKENRTLIIVVEFHRDSDARGCIE